MICCKSWLMGLSLVLGIELKTQLKIGSIVLTVPGTYSRRLSEGKHIRTRVDEIAQYFWRYFDFIELFMTRYSSKVTHKFFLFIEKSLKFCTACCNYYIDGKETNLT